MSSHDTGDATFRLVYRSHSLVPAQDRKAELGRLFTAARTNNKRQDITGALMLSGDWFVQTLEGDEAGVQSLFEHIKTDPRHDSVMVLNAGTVPGRAFPRWSMAEVATSGTDDTYLIAHDDGIAPAAPRSRTAQQDFVLDTMRDAARAEA